MGTTEQHGVEVVEIATPDGKTRASFIPAWGGIGSSLVLPFHGEPVETLYQRDFFWDQETERTRGGLPFLFPICGRLERDGEPEVYLVGGRRYRLPIHGFSLRVPWTVTAAEGDRVSLMLRDSAATREAFPFAFELRLTWIVEPGRLVGEQSMSNTGEQALPFYAGFHPFFRTPPPGAGKEDVRITLTSLRRLRYNDRLTDVIGDAPPLTFPRPATDGLLNESLHEVEPGAPARMVVPGGRQLTMTATGDARSGGFPFIQCFTVPDEPFFCIEPWMSHPNGLNTIGGACMLEPGATAATRFEIASGDGG